MGNLVIVESPGKIDNIKAYLGEGWDVMASYGHVRDLPEREMGFTAPGFVPSYVPTERGISVIDRLKRAAQKADAVYLATDADREGESIAWHIKEAIGLDNPYRIVFTEINAPAVKKAVLKPRAIDMKLVAAQELRRILDRLVGYSVSPLLSKFAGIPLSAGRVQSPAVRLVVQRELDIRKFKSTQHYGAMLKFGEWFAEWDVKTKLSPGDEYFLNKDFAEKVARITRVKVSAFDATQAKRSPPAPFITSTLQQAASNKLGFDPDYTMKLAQSLYENGLGTSGAITYMRTDNPNLSDEALGELFIEAENRGLTMADEPRRWKAKEGAQEAHEAIRPTHFEISEAGNTDDEKALYQLIWQRAFASQLEEALYNVRKTTLIGIVDGEQLTFTATGRVLSRKGWLAVLDADDTDDTEAEALNPVPALEVGQDLTVTEGKLLIKKTKAPARFTQASLIKKLEEEGIGRPSTYAAILKNISARNYVSEAKRQLYATELGEMLVDSMVGQYQFIELSFTKEMETICDRVAAGNATYKNTITEFHKLLTAEIDQFDGKSVKPANPCPDCGRALIRISNKEKKTFFWGCSGRPECTTTCPDIKGKPVAKRPPLALSAHKCPKCDKPLINRKAPAKAGKKAFNFWGCSGFPNCTEKFNDKGGSPDICNIN